MGKKGKLRSGTQKLAEVTLKMAGKAAHRTQKLWSIESRPTYIDLRYFPDYVPVSSSCFDRYLFSDGGKPRRKLVLSGWVKYLRKDEQQKEWQIESSELKLMT